MSAMRFAGVAFMTAALVSVHGVRAQVPDTSAIFAGRVVSGADAAPIAGAQVELPSLGRRAVTDSSGHFTIARLPAGLTAVSVRHVGFIERLDTVTLVAGARVERVFALEAQAPTLDTVRALAGTQKYLSPALRGFEERRLSGQGGYFISDARLRKRDNDELASVLRSYVPGLNFVLYHSMTFAASQRGNDMIGRHPPALPDDPRSPRGCWVSVWLDGVRIYDAGSGEPAPNLEIMPVNEFAGVEYYPGAATVPVQFRAMSGADCGVLLLWTREK